MTHQRKVKKKEVHLVTGGGGYPGFSLGKKLTELGHQVVLFDIREPVWSLVENMTFIQGNITCKDEVELAFKDVDCVYHMASYGMSGREQLNKKLIEAVNIGGTENVINACLKWNIMRLVYTSTYNVVFGGQDICDGDESLPYLPLDQHPDHYSRTKSIAEQIVLKSNGRKTDNGSMLCTCVLRLAGVYGPEEQRHIPRIVKNVKMGLLVVKYAPETLQDFLHVDNLVQGHVKAGQGLTQEKSYVAAGQAYFLSDDKPVNTLEFFQPLIEGLGYKLPRITLPLSVIYFIAFMTEWLHFVVARIYNFQPILTRTEVYKTGVTHYFSVKKAQRDLGYKPEIQNDIEPVVQYYIHKGYKKKKQSAIMYYFVNLIISFIFVMLIMSFVPVAR